jgi:hypothetical protein
MSAKASIQLVWVGQTGNQVITNEEIIAEGGNTIESDSLAPATVTTFTATIPLARLKGIAMGLVRLPLQTADKTAIATVRTNSNTTPDDTFSLSGTNGKAWSRGDGAVTLFFPSNTDVTQVFVENIGTGNVQFNMYWIFDATP